MNYQELRKALENVIALNDEQLMKLQKFAALLTEANDVTNLTSIPPEELVVKHFYDSLYLIHLFNFSNGKRFLDLGSGAGFPGIPLAIALPNVSFLLLDSNGKKCRFLNFARDVLALKNVEVLQSRIEDLKNLSVDGVTARAVAPLNILLELVSGILKPGSYFLAMKGGKGEEELEQSLHAQKVLGFQLSNVDSFLLPEAMGERINFSFLKNKNTPHSYPRSYALIKRKPL